MKIDPINNALAREVLTVIRKIAKDIKTDAYMRLESYTNCREQGFALSSSWSISTRKVAFSEDRNSDSVVVYFGETSDFEFNTNIPKNDAYEKRVYYRYPAEAAEAIMAYLCHSQ